MILTCAIIDDEPLAVKLLEEYVKKTFSLELVATYSSAVAALKDLEKESVDLIFCDIQMPEIDGLQFAQMMSKKRTHIIFTTAFSQYAIEGWRVDAVDYLLKPIAYEDFQHAVQRACQRIEQEQQSFDKNTKGFFVKSDYKLFYINFDDVLYIEGVKDYVRINLRNGGEPLLSLTSMRAVEMSLPSPRFQRVHRSFVVNMEAITTIERGCILFGEKALPISDSYKEQVYAYINERLLLSRQIDKI